MAAPQLIQLSAKLVDNNEQILRFIHNADEFINFKVNDQVENKEYYGEGDQFNNLLHNILYFLPDH